jgi:hypothetical protein
MTETLSATEAAQLQWLTYGFLHVGDFSQHGEFDVFVDGVKVPNVFCIMRDRVYAYTDPIHADVNGLIEMRCVEGRVEPVWGAME